MSGVDYSRFDRLVASVDAQDRREKEAAVARALKIRRDIELDALKQAEEEWLKARTATAVSASKVLPHDEQLVNNTCSSAQHLGKVEAKPNCETSNIQDTVKYVATDDFFRDPTEEEKAEKACKRAQREEQTTQHQKGGPHVLHAPELTSKQVEQEILKLEADRYEMSLLMQQADRHAVKARLCDFLVEMDNRLARLRQDPAELDDDDRQELRLFHLRKWQLPGAARSKIDFPSVTGSSPKPLRCLPTIEESEPWQPISLFALDLGEANSPNITIDVRVEAVERLPKEAITCQFRHDAFDLKIMHVLEGVRYRLLRSCLFRDIVPDMCTFSVKRNHVVLTMAKQATGIGGGGGGYLPWTMLCAEDDKSRNPPLERSWTCKT